MAALSFHVATPDLNRAIVLLRLLGGFEMYPEAFRVLILERSRRELQSPPQPVRLSRDAFEALPPDVKRLLSAESS